MEDRKVRGRVVSTLLLVLLTASTNGFSQSARPGDNARKSLDAFNQAFVHACQTMDHSASAELWTADGVDLLPGMLPMTG